MCALEEQNIKLNKEIEKYRAKDKKLKEAFGTVFYNSIYTDDSLNDVMSIKRTGD